MRPGEAVNPEISAANCACPLRPKIDFLDDRDLQQASIQNLIAYELHYTCSLPSSLIRSVIPKQR